MPLRPESPGDILELSVQVFAFGFGAWQGYVFGMAIGGTALGTLAAVNTGTLAAVFAGAALAPWRRRAGRPATSSTSGAGRPPGSP